MELYAIIGLVILLIVFITLLVYKRDAIRNMMYLLFRGESYEDAQRYKQIYAKQKEIDEEIEKSLIDQQKADNIRGVSAARTFIFPEHSHGGVTCKECDTTCSTGCTSAESASTHYIEPGVHRECTVD